MAQVNATDLQTLLATDIDSTFNVIAFNSNGETYQVEFEAATHQANTNNGCICIKEASLTIPSADVLTLNSTPLTIVPAQGVGTAIEVLSASLQITFNSVAYATNTSLQLYADGSGEIQTSNSINQTADAFSKFEPEIGATGSIQFVENAALLVNVNGGDPTAGDSDITVYVTYRVITI